ncbi:MAG: fibronectin type III domain-containing protein, partial [Gammaproteobacteria bacterium]
MKNKLITLLVTSTLQFYATSATAQVGSCDIVGNNTSANAATAVSSGPLNPVNGFPEYVTDSNGVSLQRCLDAGLCLFDPIVETDPFSLQIGSGGEAFYWNATAQVVVPGGKRVLTLVMAAETAFLQSGPNGEPINGSQTAFLRLRFTMDVPVAGTYTVRYPYGTEVFTVETARANRDITHTVDRGFSANSTVIGSVGPFLREILPPDGYLGSAVEPGNEVTGSPCNRNFVEITGVDEFGNPVDWGGGITAVTSNLFTVMGKFHDGTVQTPLSPTRLTYSRAAQGAGQIETFAASAPSATVTVKDGPTIPAGSSRLPAPLTMDHLDTRDSLVVPVADATALPPVISMTSTDAGTDPSTLNLPLVDFVDIALAEYDQDTGVLTVSASSGDRLTPPRLTLRDYAAFAPGSALINIFTQTPPAVVHVDSASGGSASAQVRVKNTNAPPTSPAALSLLAVSQSAVSLRWTDRATTEDGFRVVASTAGQPDVTATVPPNTTETILGGLLGDTTYTLRVEAFNHIGAERSGDLIVATLAPPAGPSTVLSSLGVEPGRVAVNWSPSGDASGYHLYRSVGGVVTLISGAAPLPASVLNFTDTSAPVGSSVIYQVATVRTNALGTDIGLPTEAIALQTPALPAAPTGVSAALGESAATLSWTGSTDATGYRIYRSIGGGAFVALGGLLQGGTSSYVDANLPGGVYTYQVAAVNWAGETASTASNPITIAILNAATGARGTNAAQPQISWTDQS